MKKLIRSVLIISLLTSLPFILGEEVEKVVKNSPSPSKYPDAKGLILNSEMSFKLDKEGNLIEEVQKLVKICNAAGREKFSDFRVRYDKNLHKVTVNWAKTVKADLTSIDVKQDAINDVTPIEIYGADIYANILHKVLSFSAVVPGVTLAINYKKESNLAEDIHLSDMIYFQTDEPILYKKLKISIPSEKKIKYKIIGMESDFKIERQDEENIYLLEASDSSQIKPEEFMPPLSEIASRVVFSTYENWEHASEKFSRSFYKAIEPTEEIKKFAEQLIKECRRKDEKLEKIFLYVARNIRNVPLKLGVAGYECHPAKIVLENRYGDWRDKSVLLVSLLKAVGIEAYPAMVNSKKSPLVEEVPSLKQFDMILVAIPRENGSYFFLNPFADSSLFGYFYYGRNAEALIIKPKAVEFKKVVCPEDVESIALNEIEAEIEEKGQIKGKVRSRLSGIFDLRTRKRIKDLTKKEMDMFLGEAINKICEGAVETKHSLSDAKNLTEPMEIYQEFQGEDFGIMQGDIMLIHVPPFPYGFAKIRSLPRLAKRRYAFRVTTECEYQLAIKLKIPETFKPFYLPSEISYKTDYGKFFFSYNYLPEKSLVEVRKHFIFDKVDIPLDKYDEFKKNLDSFGITKNNLILLERK